MAAVVGAMVFVAAACSRNESASPSPASSATTSPSAAPTPTSSACDVPGSGTQSQQGPAAAGTQALLSDVRFATTACPRVVFQFENHAPSFVVEYRRPPFANCGSGAAVDTSAWGSSAYIVFHSNAASGVDLSGTTFRQTYTKSKDIAVSSPVLRRIRETCDFEGTLEWVVALDARHRFKVSARDSPPRLVVDVSQAPA